MHHKFVSLVQVFTKPNHDVRPHFELILLKQVCIFNINRFQFRLCTSHPGPGLLLVGLYSSLGPCERLVIKRFDSSSSHIYKVSYRVRKRGHYMLVILYGSTMQNVPGSPYLVRVE